MNWVQTPSDVETAQMKLLYAALFISVGILPASAASSIKISKWARREFHEPKSSGHNGEWMAAPSGQKSASVPLEKRFPSVRSLITKFAKHVGKHSQQSLRFHLRQMYRDNPDKMILRYIRAMGDSKKIMSAIGVALSTYYGPYNPVDLLRKGEAHFYFEEPLTGIQVQHEACKRIIVGHDKQNRPVNVLHARRAFPKAQTYHESDMFSLYLLELTYLMCQDTVDGAVIIFDLQGLSRANMDSRILKFIFFQLNKLYPMVLHRFIIYKGPLALQAAYRIMYGWLDPAMRDKVKFVNRPDEILAHVSSSQLPKLLGGTSLHEHKWIPPRREDDAPMLDTATRDDLLRQREALALEIERFTSEWIVATGPILKLEQTRRSLIDDFMVLYWQLDPYMRSRTVFDRNGIFGQLKAECREGGVAQPVCRVKRSERRGLPERSDAATVDSGRTKYEVASLNTQFEVDFAGQIKPLEDMSLFEF